MKGIKRIEFENGLVLLTERRLHAQKAMMLVGIKVGSINEDDKLNGGSHYNEHLLFKSNKYRTAKQITEDLEFEGTSVKASGEDIMSAKQKRNVLIIELRDEGKDKTKLRRRIR